MRALENYARTLRWDTKYTKSKFNVASPLFLLVATIPATPIHQHHLHYPQHTRCKTWFQELFPDMVTESKVPYPASRRHFNCIIYSPRLRVPEFRQITHAWIQIGLRKVLVSTKSTSARRHIVRCFCCWYNNKINNETSNWRSKCKGPHNLSRWNYCNNISCKRKERNDQPPIRRQIIQIWFTDTQPRRTCRINLCSQWLRNYRSFNLTKPNSTTRPHRISMKPMQSKWSTPKKRYHYQLP